MRRFIVVLGAAIFALIWSSNALLSISLIVLTTERADSGSPGWWGPGLGVVLFVVLTAAFIARHWSAWWPLGGFGGGPGSRAWTAAFIGGALVLLVGSCLKLPELPSASVANIGAREGPTVIYTSLAPARYSLRQIMPALGVHVAGCVVTLLGAAWLARRHR